jgi:hypothetical protein
MKATVIEMQVKSTKQSQSYHGKDKTQHEIELGVTYNVEKIFQELSSGTELKLATINDEVAAMFKHGKKVKVTIEVLEDEQE